MFPYLITFFISYIFIYIASKYSKSKQNKFLRSTLLLMAIITLSMLAALRNETIGTDILTYVNKYFDAALYTQGITTYLEIYPLEMVEPLYKILTYVCSMISSDVRFLYFVIEFIDCAFVVAFLWENREKSSVLFGVFVYTMLLYNISFNAVRQTMALCICLYSLNAVKDKRLIKFIVLMLVAFLIHKSSIIMTISYPLYTYLDRQSVRKIDGSILRIVFLGIGGLFFINYIAGFLMSIGVFPVKYSHYMNSGYSFGRLSSFAFVLPIILICILYRRKLYQNDKINALLISYVLIWPFYAQLDSLEDQFGRLAFYFMSANIYLYAQIPKLKIGSSSHNILNSLILCFLAVIFWSLYWFVNFVIWNTGETVPYMLGV